MNAFITSPRRYGWVTAYGWLFIAAGLYLFVTGLVTLFAGQDATPPPVAFVHAKSIGIVSAILQALLFVATGLAVVRRNKLAVRLVWLNVFLSALGVLGRGLIPIDILVWLFGLGLAIWFTKKTAALSLDTKPVVGP